MKFQEIYHEDNYSDIKNNKMIFLFVVSDKGSYLFKWLAALYHTNKDCADLIKEELETEKFFFNKCIYMDGKLQFNDGWAAAYKKFQVWNRCLFYPPKRDNKIHVVSAFPKNKVLLSFRRFPKKWIPEFDKIWQQTEDFL